MFSQVEAILLQVFSPCEGYRNVGDQVYPLLLCKLPSRAEGLSCPRVDGHRAEQDSSLPLTCQIRLLRAFVHSHRLQTEMFPRHHAIPRDFDMQLSSCNVSIISDPGSVNLQAKINRDVMAFDLGRL